MWQKLEEENADFFRAYYIRLKLKRQILLFNHLLEHQYHLMKYPVPPKLPLAPMQNGIHPMPGNFFFITIAIVVLIYSLTQHCLFIGCFTSEACLAAQSTTCRWDTRSFHSLQWQPRGNPISTPWPVECQTATSSMESRRRVTTTTTTTITL